MKMKISYNNYASNAQLESFIFYLISYLYLIVLVNMHNRDKYLFGHWFLKKIINLKILKKTLFGFLLIQLIKTILDTSLAAASITRSSGWYFDGNAWSKCDVSCKTCSSGTKWDTCEEFMYLELTTHLWKFWSDGEYYDYTYSLCRTWGSTFIFNLKF